jgi:hypothetical protein
MTMGAQSVHDDGVEAGSTRLEAILAAIVTPLVLLVVAVVLPRSRDAWGIPARGAKRPACPSARHGYGSTHGQ